MIHQINYVISKKKDEERCIFVCSHVEIINLVNVIDSDNDLTSERADLLRD